MFIRHADSSFEKIIVRSKRCFYFILIWLSIIVVTPQFWDQMLTSFQCRKPLTTGSSFLMLWSTSAQKKTLAHGYPATSSLVSSRVAIKSPVSSPSFPILFISFLVRDVPVNGTAPSIDMMCIYCLNKPFHYLISFLLTCSFCIRLASGHDGDPMGTQTSWQYWFHRLPRE